MKVVFYFDHDRYAGMAAVAAASARRAMPGVTTVQLCLPGMSRVGAIQEIAPLVESSHTLARRRWAAHAAMGEGDFLFVDVDVVFRADVRPVFDAAFELAVPRIDDPYWHHSAGVTYSRCPAFWQRLSRCAVCVRSTEAPLEQVLAAYNTAVAVHAGEVLQLPHTTYERLPLGANDRCEGAAMIHYRGPRKKWMPPA